VLDIKTNHRCPVISLKYVPEWRAMAARNSLTGVRSGLRLLSLDDGGIRGISSLIILNAIMEKINANRPQRLLPKDCFDLAGGTSTGGLIALMLFRLGMDTQDAIDIYRDMAKNVFSPRLPDLLGGFSLHKLGFVGYCLGNPYLRLKALLLPSSFSDFYLKAAIDDVMKRNKESGDDKLRKSGTAPM
jgi:hypothetical protein